MSGKEKAGEAGGAGRAEAARSVRPPPVGAGRSRDPSGLRLEPAALGVVAVGACGLGAPGRGSVGAAAPAEPEEPFSGAEELPPAPEEVAALAPAGEAPAIVVCGKEGEPGSASVGAIVPPAAPSATEPAGLVAVVARLGRAPSEPARVVSVAPPPGPETVVCRPAPPAPAPVERSTPAEEFVSEAAADAPESVEAPSCVWAEPAGVWTSVEALAPEELAEAFAWVEAAGLETLTPALVPDEPESEPEPVFALVPVETAGVETLAEVEAEAVVGVDETLGCEGGGGGGACCTPVVVEALTLVPALELVAEAETLTLVD